MDQCSRCYEPIVAKVIIIRHEEDIAIKLHEAVLTCVQKRKPVYLEIACNLSNCLIPKPAPTRFHLAKKVSDKWSLDAALEDASERIRLSVRPVLIAGSKLLSDRDTKCSIHAFEVLANKLGAAVAVMPDAKGLFNEEHHLFIGTYWGIVSSRLCGEIVESSDCQIFVGPVFNDYTTSGYGNIL